MATWAAAPPWLFPSKFMSQHVGGLIPALAGRLTLHEELIRGVERRSAAYAAARNYSITCANSFHRLTPAKKHSSANCNWRLSKHSSFMAS